MAPADLPVTLADVQRARDVLKEPTERGIIKRTPTIHSESVSGATGADVFLKLENLQRTGAFKVRGAYNRIHDLTASERANGVIAASAGNHAQGVALAARELDVPATICMPEDAPISKVQATRAFGAEVVLRGVDYNEAYDHARVLGRERGLSFVHPYDDPAIIAGQGTVGLEIVEALPELDAVVVGVGGGGLLAGIAVAVKGLRPEARVIGVEPAGAAAFHASRAAGHRVELDRVDTIADGLATRQAGELPMALCNELVDDVVTVEDNAIANAILVLLEREKSLVEGAGAASVAGLLEGAVPVEPGERVAAVVSGGNIDVTLLENVIDRGLVRSGRYLKVEVPLSDRPGSLRDLLDVIAHTRANVHRVDHSRKRADVGVRHVLVRVELETRGAEHKREVLEHLASAGYMVSVDE